MAVLATVDGGDSWLDSRGDQSGKRRSSHSLGDEVLACRSGPRSGKLRPGEISRNFRDDVTNNEPEVTIQGDKGSVLLGTSV